MRTKKQVLADRPEYKALINAVISNVGMSSVNDINQNGIGGGYGGMVYYKDTCEFYRKHKADILKIAQEMAEDLGEDMLTMISEFNCLKDMKLTPSEIGEALWADSGDMKDQIQNAMTWFAGEEVCGMFEN